MSLRVKVDPSKKGRELVSEGRHFATIKTIEPGQSNSGSEYLEFTFLVNGGGEVNEKLYLSEAAAWRVNLFAKRLGLIEEDATEETECDFAEAISTDVVIEVVHEEYVSSKDGQTKKVGKLSGSGIWAVDDPDHEMGNTPPRKPSKAAPTAKPAPRPAPKPAGKPKPSLNGLGLGKGRSQPVVEDAEFDPEVPF